MIFSWFDAGLFLWPDYLLIKNMDYSHSRHLDIGQKMKYHGDNLANAYGGVYRDPIEVQDPTKVKENKDMLAKATKSGTLLGEDLKGSR